MDRSVLVFRVAGLAACIAMMVGCGGRLLPLGKAKAVDGATDLSLERAAADASVDASCPHAQVKASEVLWIGDSWITIPGTQYKSVQEYASKAGAIAAGDEYEIAAKQGATMAMVADQYTSRQVGSKKYKIVIMDGGTYDPIINGATDTVINNVVATFKQFLEEVRSDGSVEHVVYFLCPELAKYSDNAATGVRMLRQPMQDACNASTSTGLPCHFIDLQNDVPWVDQYTDPLTNIQASAAGAEIIAKQIWSTMQVNCIAQ
jgi:hypothetical protein